MRFRITKTLKSYHSYDELKKVWVEPAVWDRIAGESVWVLTGHKGSGKTSILEYLRSDPLGSHCIVVKAKTADAYETISNLISFDEKTDHRVTEHNVSRVLELALLMSLGQYLIEGKSDAILSGPVATVYSFLVAHNLTRPSAIKQVIGVASKVLKAVGAVKDADSLAQVAQATVTEADYKDAVVEVCRALDTKILFCIDEIDDTTFAFSRADRIIINALVSSVMRLNEDFQAEEANAQFLLSCPQELYSHLSLWGSDKVEQMRATVRWKNPRDLENLVTKAVAYEAAKILNTKFSEGLHGWPRYFPKMVENRWRQNEIAFQYVLRHTQSIPRQVTLLIDSIVEHLESVRGCGLLDCPEIKRGDRISDFDWNDSFRIGIMKGTQSISKSQVNIYTTLFPNIDDCVEALRDRPYVWRKDKIIKYVEELGLTLNRDRMGLNGPMPPLKGASLVDELQRLGFLGYAVRNKRNELPGQENYDLFFSFLEEWPFEGAWHYAVIAPMFFDYLGSAMPMFLKIDPAQQMRLPDRMREFLESYDVSSNTGMFYGAAWHGTST